MKITERFEKNAELYTIGKTKLVFLRGNTVIHFVLGRGKPCPLKT